MQRRRRHLRIELEKLAEQAEEDRKKKAGEFDAWRQQIGEKHEKALVAERDKTKAEADARAKAEERWRNDRKAIAFANALDVFGKDALTIYTPSAAQRVFGEYVGPDCCLRGSDELVWTFSPMLARSRRGSRESKHNSSQ